MVMGFKPAEVRKFLVTVAAFLTAVVAVVLEATIGFYGDGEINTGEWLALAVLALNSIGVFKVPNDEKGSPHDDLVGEEVDDPLDADHEHGMEGQAQYDASQPVGDDVFRPWDIPDEPGSRRI